MFFLRFRVGYVASKTRFWPVVARVYTAYPGKSRFSLSLFVSSVLILNILCGNWYIKRSGLFRSPVSSYPIDSLDTRIHCTVCRASSFASLSLMGCLLSSDRVRLRRFLCPLPITFPRPLASSSLGPPLLLPQKEDTSPVRLLSQPS